jgi:phosphonate transport system permease protein
MSSATAAAGLLPAPAYVPPSAQFRRRMLWLGGLLAFLVIGGAYLKFKPWMLITDFHHLVRLAGEMVPPNFALLWQKTSLFKTIGETVAMAFLGTLVGGAVAFALAFVASRNTSPHRLLRAFTRLLFGFERATPNFVVLLVLFIAFGYGPFAAMIALAVGSIGLFGKLFADAIEQVDPGPCESVASVGATRLQVIRYAIIPQVLPSVVANGFYAFDVNLRAAIALGVYGGGGIGFELQLAMKVLRYPDVLALILFIIVLITGMERVSDFVRRRILSGSESLK